MQLGARLLLGRQRGAQLFELGPQRRHPLQARVGHRQQIPRGLRLGAFLSRVRLGQRDLLGCFGAGRLDPAFGQRDRLVALGLHRFERGVALQQFPLQPHHLLANRSVVVLDLGHARSRGRQRLFFGGRDLLAQELQDARVDHDRRGIRRHRMLGQVS
ncbi:hypothetical protein [Cupriavidus necator]